MRALGIPGGPQRMHATVTFAGGSGTEADAGARVEAEEDVHVQARQSRRLVMGGQPRNGGWQ
jgi:hypothetical protein